MYITMLLLFAVALSLCTVYAAPLDTNTKLDELLNLFNKRSAEQTFLSWPRPGRSDHSSDGPVPMGKRDSPVRVGKRDDGRYIETDYLLEGPVRVGKRDQPVRIGKRSDDLFEEDLIDLYDDLKREVFDDVINELTNKRSAQEAFLHGGSSDQQQEQQKRQNAFLHKRMDKNNLISLLKKIIEKDSH